MFSVRNSSTARRRLQPALPAAQCQKSFSTTTPRRRPSFQARREFKNRFQIGDTVVYSQVGTEKKVTFPNIFLRDNCPCKSCVHQATRQRLLDTWKIPANISIKSTQQDDDNIHIGWSDDHWSIYPKSWLAQLARGNASTVRYGSEQPILWGSNIKSGPPTANYRDVMNSDEGLLDWLLKIRRYGFSFVDGCPVDPTATEKLLRRIAFVRETHYGGFYDFTSDLSSKDTAYTSIALDAHTDNTYFSDPSGLQMFHLLSHTEGSGGSSLLVDGFQAAAQLKQQDAEAYEILSTVNVHNHASGNEGISIQPYRPFPILSHGHGPLSEELTQVRWNSSDRAAIDAPFEELEKWYDAARKWFKILSSAENEYWEQLKPGHPVVFDNWRVLHGRSAFTGKRRICGGYVNRDDWISRFNVLRHGQEKVLQSLASA